MSYIRDAPLASSSTWARQAVRGRSLEEVEDSVRHGLSQKGARAASVVEHVVRSVATQCVFPQSAVHQTEEMYEDLRVSLSRCTVDPAQQPIAPAAHVDNLARNPKSGIVHRIAAGYSVDLPDGWDIACGWKPSAATRVHVLPSSYKDMCSKCLPLERACAKAVTQG